MEVYCDTCGKKFEKEEKKESNICSSCTEFHYTTLIKKEDEIGKQLAKEGI